MHPEVERKEYVSSIHKELENRVKWLETGLKMVIKHSLTITIQQMAQAYLDGEPTTADESNVVYISDVNKEIAKEWKNEKEEE